MSVEREALEAHLRGHPEDWPSWLVYADWLLEQGDARGAHRARPPAHEKRWAESEVQALQRMAWL